MDRAAPEPDPLPPDPADALAALAAARPRTGWEMARAIDAAEPGALERHEGAIYPLLASLVREGRLEARWIDEPGGRPRRVYAVPGSAAPAPAAEAPLPLAAPPRLQAAARDAARQIPGLFERESARAEILGHLECSAAAWARLGLDADTASRRALEGLGDPWKLRTDLGRVHRGRPIVVFPRTAGEWFHAIAIYDLAPLAVVVAVLLLARWQVVQAYNIPTSSMEPTLHGELAHPDYILVDKTAFLRRNPRRWDIVVFNPPEKAERSRSGEEAPEKTAFVKRCVGLGGESLDLLGGDLYVDGRLARRGRRVEDAMMVPLYDLGRDLRDSAARSRSGFLADMVFDGTWTMRTGAWSIRGDAFHAAPTEDGEARLEKLGELTNSYLQVDGNWANYYAPAGDLEVRFRAEPRDPGTTVGADLTEGTGDAAQRHSLRIGPHGVLLRSGSRTWRSPLARAGAGRPLDVAFRNVDDRLTVSVDGETLLRVKLPARTTRPREPEPGGVELVAEGGCASFGAVRILRDIVYVRGEGSWPRVVPGGSLFMLGDNTGNSSDSRVWGTVPEKDLIGVPFFVVYPPTRVKVLR
jgi:signal peptidase I